MLKLSSSNFWERVCRPRRYRRPYLMRSLQSWSSGSSNKPTGIGGLTRTSRSNSPAESWQLDRHAGMLRQTALGLMASGDALKLLGRTQEAWQALDEAGEMYRAAGDEIGWGRTRIGRLYLSTMLNRVPEALADAETARDIFLRSGELEKLLRLDFQVAFVYDYLGDQFKALEHYQLALDAAEGVGDAAQQHLGPLFTNMGNAYKELGDYRQAQEYYERAYVLFEARGDILHLTTLESNMGYLAQAQGNYRIALRLLNRALARVAGKFDVKATQIKWHLLDCYQGLNRHSEALEMAEQVVADYRKFNDSFELGRALLQLATIEAELAKLEAAQIALMKLKIFLLAWEQLPGGRLPGCGGEGSL